MSILLIDFESELLQLHSSLRTLRAHIESIAKVEKLISTLEADTSSANGLSVLVVDLHRDFLSSPGRRVFEFSSTVISLSGFLEAFVENVLRAYLRGLRGIADKYSDLPAILIDRHVPLSFQLIEKIEYSRFKGKLSVEAIIGNLNSCTSGDPKFVLNEEGFVFHAANFREKVLNEYFRQVGVDNFFGLIRQHGSVKEFLESRALGPKMRLTYSTISLNSGMKWRMAEKLQSWQRN